MLKLGFYETPKTGFRSGQVSITNRETESDELFTQLEVYVLIFLAIIIQVIILYRPSKGWKIEW